MALSYSLTRFVVIHIQHEKKFENRLFWIYQVLIMRFKPFLGYMLFTTNYAEYTSVLSVITVVNSDSSVRTIQQRLFISKALNIIQINRSLSLSISRPRIGLSNYNVSNNNYSDIYGISKAIVIASFCSCLLDSGMPSYRHQWWRLWSYSGNT